MGPRRAARNQRLSMDNFDSSRRALGLCCRDGPSSDRSKSSSRIDRSESTPPCRSINPRQGIVLAAVWTSITRLPTVRTAPPAGHAVEPSSTAGSREQDNGLRTLTVGDDGTPPPSKIRPVGPNAHRTGPDCQVQYEICRCLEDPKRRHRGLVRRRRRVIQSIGPVSSPCLIRVVLMVGGESTPVGCAIGRLPGPVPLRYIPPRQLLQQLGDAAGLICWDVAVDSMILRAPARSRRSPGPGRSRRATRCEPVDHALGRSRDRWTTTLHLACEQGRKP